ncbi:MAG: hypothetical protein HXY37_18685, partial [Chloroflexi bacterium]|nr:hypothetical protein [Chloroflexota bacterium]
MLANLSHQASTSGGAGALLGSLTGGRRGSQVEGFWEVRPRAPHTPPPYPLSCQGRGPESGVWGGG